MSHMRATFQKKKKSWCRSSTMKEYFPSQSFIVQESNNFNEDLNFQRMFVLEMIFEIFLHKFYKLIYVSLIIKM